MFRSSDATREVTRSLLGHVSRDIMRNFWRRLPAPEKKVLSICLAEADEQTCEVALTTNGLRVLGAGSNLGRISAARKKLVAGGFLEWIMDRRLGNRGRVPVFKVACPPVGGAEEARLLACKRPTVEATVSREAAKCQHDCWPDSGQQSHRQLAGKRPTVAPTVSREAANSGPKSVPPHTPPLERDLNTELAAQARALEAVTAISIYDAYPRKVARRRAIRAIDQALKRLAASKSEVPKGGWAAWLLERTTRYRDIRRRCWSDEVEKFTPHPATWFNDERYLDDPETWEPLKGRLVSRRQQGANYGSARADRRAIIAAREFPSDLPTGERIYGSVASNNGDAS